MSLLVLSSARAVAGTFSDAHVSYLVTGKPTQQFQPSFVSGSPERRRERLSFGTNDVPSSTMPTMYIAESVAGEPPHAPDATVPGWPGRRLLQRHDDRGRFSLVQGKKRTRGLHARDREPRKPMGVVLGQPDAA